MKSKNMMFKMEKLAQEVIKARVEAKAKIAF
jgi:hypothetical protein